jgi:DNA-binding GntR family transcriptional regulator
LIYKLSYNIVITKKGVKNKLTGEEVYKKLEKEIILGILKPRERLVEAELCKK